MPAPQMPYRVEPRPAGLGREQLCKFHGDQTAGEWMSPDEEAVYEYVKHLEAENARLTADLEQATAPTRPVKAKAGK